MQPLWIQKILKSSIICTKDAHIDYTAVGGIAGNLQEIIKYLETA